MLKHTVQSKRGRLRGVPNIQPISIRKLTSDSFQNPYKRFLDRDEYIKEKVPNGIASVLDKGQKVGLRSKHQGHKVQNRSSVVTNSKQKVRQNPVSPHKGHKVQKRSSVVLNSKQKVRQNPVSPRSNQKPLPRRSQASSNQKRDMATTLDNINLAIDLRDETEVNQLSDIDLNEMELDDVHPVITPLSHEEEFSYDFNNKDSGRPHYKQNQSNFTNISPRAAKYRDSKLKLPRHITVPQAAGSTRVSSAGQMSRSHSPSQHGSMRGHPTTPNNVMSRSSSGTIKSLHSGFHGSIRGLSSGDGTLRIYQHEALSPGGGFRSNHLPQGSAVPKVPNSFASVAMRRRIRKEDYVTHFAVELDLHERHRYCPGEEIGGKIVFDVSGKLEIRFIEFQIIGQTLLSFARKGYHGPKSLKDTFLCKRSYVVGTPDGKWGSVVTPGHYVSKFRFRLPEGLPSSLRYKDDSNGFGTEISYKVKARICDDLGSSSIRSTHSVQNYVKILMTRQVSFTVKRPFDIHSIPMALTPVVHTEELSLSTCSFFSPDLTTFSLSLDRSCFLAGDEIKVRLQISNFTKQIEKIRGELQQNVTVHKPKFHLTFTIADFEQTDTKGTLMRDNKQLYELAMPTRIGVLPSINPGCRMFNISYNLQVVIHFSSCGGQLTLDVPIRIGPCTDPVNLEKKNSVPVFNRPMRFPYFSLHENGKIQNGHVQNHVQPIRAAVKSSHSRTNSSVFCCWGPDTLM